MWEKEEEEYSRTTTLTKQISIKGGASKNWTI